MKNWKKTALKSAHSPKVQRVEETQAEYKKVDHELSEDAEDDLMDAFLREFAVYTNHRMQEECEAIQREMADVEVPPSVLTRLDKMAEEKEKELLALKKRQCMRRRVTSAACVFFLFFAVGAGIFVSPQSEHLKSELYELLMGSEDTEEAAYSDSDGSGIHDSKGEDDAALKVSEEDGISKAAEQYGDKNRVIVQKNGTSEKTSPASPQTGKENSGKTEPSQGNNSSGGFQPDPGDSAEPESPSGGGGAGKGDSGVIEDIPDFPQALDRVYYPDYLPKGYHRTFVSTGDCVEIIFKNSETQNLLTMEYYPKGFDFYEAAAEDGKNVSVNGSKAVLYYRNPLNTGIGQTVLYWNRENASIRVQCPTGSISDNELLHVAESVALKTTDSIS